MQFEKAYKNLNDQQKEAVEAIEGPVLVVAGPGTGKTQLLSMRVANILKKTDTSARNILCLTFTNKAAVNMRDRLNMLTAGEGRDVAIKTFHSFAADIMNSYPEKFWNGANLQSAPDSVQLDILQQIFENLPKDNPYRIQFDGKFTQLTNAMNGIKLAKEAGLTPEKLHALLEFNLAYIDTIEPAIIEALSPTLRYKDVPILQQKIASLPKQQLDVTLAPLMELATVISEGLEFAVEADEGTNKTKHVGEWKKRWLQTEKGEKGMFKIRRSCQRWIALADIYATYRQQLHAKGYYDYSDMLLEVITQLEQDDELKSDVQERYNYVLVDEFQDSNAAQLRLAHLVADHHSAEGLPNIMAVGDDDQSIYGFNGAELNNLLYFNRNFEKVTTVVLTENYRSAQAVLDAAEQTIALCEDRLVTRLPHLTKHLIAKNEPKETGILQHLVFDDIDQQYTALAEDIAAHHRAHPNETIAVLARQNKNLSKLAGILNEQHHIPIIFEKGQDILELPAVQLIHLIFQTIDAIHQGDAAKVSAALAELLPHPIWGLPPELLWEIAKENRYQVTWLEAIREKEETTSLTQWLELLAQESAYTPLERMLEYVLGIRELETSSFESPLKTYYLENQGNEIDHEYLKTLSGIRTLRSAICEAALNTTTTVTDWLRFLETMRANGQVLSDQSVFLQGENAVELMTIHKAKGLEFDRVYIINAQDSIWQPKAERNQPPANLPLRPPLETMDDYTRLMYVAITRAKRDVIVSSYRFDQRGEETLATPLIAHFPIEQRPLISDKATSILTQALTWPRLTHATEKELLQPILDTFTINPTNLINFLDVTNGGPETFLLRNLLRLPGVKSDAMSHGTAMHAALELGQKLTNLQKFSLESIIQEYARAIKIEQLSPEQQVLQNQEGERILRYLFETLRYELPKGSTPERSLQNIKIEAATIGGKLDRIDTEGDILRIVDYKTGTPLHSFATKDKNKAIKAWKHKLQLTFYALLARHHPDYQQFHTIEGQMVYLHATTEKELCLSYIPSDEEVARLAKLIQAVWYHVQNFQLPDTTSYTSDISGIIAFEEYLLTNKS